MVVLELPTARFVLWSRTKYIVLSRCPDPLCNNHVPRLLDSDGERQLRIVGLDTDRGEIHVDDTRIVPVKTAFVEVVDPMEHAFSVRQRIQHCYFLLIPAGAVQNAVLIISLLAWSSLLPFCKQLFSQVLVLQP